MKPDYSTLPQLVANTTKQGRTYTVVGHPEIAPMPSITTVLGATGDKSGLIRWKERVGEAEAERISQEAKDRGTLVHAFLEASFGVDVDDPQPSQERAVGAAIADLIHDDTGFTMAKNLAREARKHMRMPWVQEIGLYSPTLQVAGRTDVIGEWDGVPSVVDWKSSRKPKREEWIQDYALQGSFYARCHNELFGTAIENVVIGITCETGDVQIFTFSAAAYQRQLEDRITTYRSL